MLRYVVLNYRNTEYSHGEDHHHCGGRCQNFLLFSIKTQKHGEHPVFIAQLALVFISLDSVISVVPGTHA